MKTLGVFVKLQKGAYVAGFALADENHLLREDRFPAPADEDTARQLSDLYRHVRDLVGQFAPDAVALKASEIQGGGNRATIAHRAEGAALAAAGEVRELEVTVWLASSMWSLAGFSKRPANVEVVRRLCQQLDRSPTSDEAKQAAAAARCTNLAGIRS